jgi:hypothetical protein
MLWVDRVEQVDTLSYGYGYLRLENPYLYRKKSTSLPALPGRF